MFGYNGKLLLVNLTTQESYWEPLSDTVLRDFIGGIGLGTYLLYNYCPTNAEPLGPDNPLIFVASPLVGSRLTTSSKFAVVTKSPLTGFIGDSLSSSFLALELKKTGCDALVIIGKSTFPTLLHINNGVVQFLDGRDLTGLDTLSTEKAVKNVLGSRTCVACIGPAGENLVRFASISNDGGRQAGRTGSGAVMGSKNLKAIAFNGNNPVRIYNSEALNRIGKNLTKKSLGVATEKYRTLGTIANVSVFNRLGTLPTRNFQQSTFPEADQMSGEKLHSSHFVKNAHCANCTIGCEKILVTSDSGTRSTGRLEYESAFALGPLLGIANPNAILRASHFCDEVGMDTISAGVTIAWAMECFDKGIFTMDDTDGLDLRFGNEEAVIECLKMISTKRAIGAILADGSLRASQLIGHNSEQWAMHVKGLEMPGYEPRSLKTMALGLAVSTRGACHNRSSAYEADFSAKVDRLTVDETRGRITMEGEDFSSVLDSLIWCKFLRKAFGSFYAESAAIYEQLTGWPMTPVQLRKTGERINNLKKLFNIREGWKRADDTLPPRILKEQLTDGVVDSITLCQEDLDMMINDYYFERGWTKDGLIPESKLAELQLTNIGTSRVHAS